MKATKIETNRAGRKYALVAKEDGTWTVYAECRNYAAHVLGGIATTWRYCEKGLTEAAALALFARKLKGKQKA